LTYIYIIDIIQPGQRSDWSPENIDKVRSVIKQTDYFYLLLWHRVTYLWWLFET